MATTHLSSWGGRYPEQDNSELQSEKGRNRRAIGELAWCIAERAERVGARDPVQMFESVVETHACSGLRKSFR